MRSKRRTIKGFFLLISLLWFCNLMVYLGYTVDHYLSIIPFSPLSRHLQAIAYYITSLCHGMTKQFSGDQKLLAIVEMFVRKWVISQAIFLIWRRLRSWESFHYVVLLMVCYSLVYNSRGGQSILRNKSVYKYSEVHSNRLWRLFFLW